MNAGNQLLAVIQAGGNSAVIQITASLESGGYQVNRSFDLLSAVTAQRGCNSGSDYCACQMIVLLVYAQAGPPVTLICNSDEMQTMIYLVNSPMQRTHPDWVGTLTQLFSNNLNHSIQQNDINP